MGKKRWFPSLLKFLKIQQQWTSSIGLFELNFPNKKVIPPSADVSFPHVWWPLSPQKKKEENFDLSVKKIFALAAAFHPWRWHLVNVLRGPGHGHRQNRPKICLGFPPKMARSPSSKEITRLAQFVSRKARASRNWPTSSLRAVHQRQRQLNSKWIEIIFVKKRKSFA